MENPPSELEWMLAPSELTEKWASSEQWKKMTKKMTEDLETLVEVLKLAPSEG
jgi:hypothetical protein